MTAKGYVLLARSLDDSEVAKMSPCTRELWIYLLRMVNYADNGRIKRGQGFFSLEQIQTDLEWWVGYRRVTYSKPDLTKALRRLREGNMIETTKEVRGVLVTVCKYEHYQDPSNYEGNGSKQRRKEHRSTGVHTISEEGKKKKKRTPEGVLADEPQLPLDVPDASRTEDPPAPRADHRDPDVQAVVDYLTSQLQAKGIAQSLDRTWIRTKGGRDIDANRADARHLLQRLAKDYPRHDPVESARRLINLALSSDFYAPKCTTVGYLYRKMSEIIASSKRTKTNGPRQPQQGLADKANGALQILLAGAVPAGDAGGGHPDPIAAEPGA